MRLLFTTFSYFPERSGVPIVVQYLAEGLAKKGHEVCVVTRKNGNDFPDEEFVNGVNVRRFNIGLTLTKRNTGNINEYIEFVKNWPKDVLVLECLQCHTTDILLPHLFEMNCKIVIHSHGTPGIKMKVFAWCGDWIHTIGHTVNWFRFKRYYKQILPKYVDAIDVGVSLSLCSSDMAYFTKHLRKIAIVENAANDIFFDEASYEKDISNIIKLKSNKYIVNISNFGDRKNQLALIREFEKANLQDCALVLIGSKKNTYYERVCKLSAEVMKRTGCEILVLQGVERHYFPSIIAHAMLFVMTSKFEEYPVSLVEAMAVGTPFVSTMVGNAHTLPGGIVAREFDEVSVLLKTLNENPAILERTGEQGKRYAIGNNTVNAVVGKFESVLLSC